MRKIYGHIGHQSDVANGMIFKSINNDVANFRGFLWCQLTVFIILHDHSQLGRFNPNPPRSEHHADTVVLCAQRSSNGCWVRISDQAFSLLKGRWVSLRRSVIRYLPGFLRGQSNLATNQIVSTLVKKLSIVNHDPLYHRAWLAYDIRRPPTLKGFQGLCQPL